MGTNDTIEAPKLPASRVTAQQTPATKLFIGLPIYWGIDPLFHRCLMQVHQALIVRSLVGECPYNGQIDEQPGDSLVPRARNSLTHRFLASDSTHLLWIDSDLVFSLEQIDRLISHDVDIVGGLYPKKQEGDAQLVLNTFDNNPPETDSRGLAKVQYVGTGFMLIKRSVFEKMIDKWGDEIWYTEDSSKRKEYDFWHCGVYTYPNGSRRYLSEDWWFCQKCLDLGLTVYADTAVLLKHSGHVLFPLSYQEKQLFGRQPIQPVAVSADSAGVGCVPTAPA